MCLSKVERNVWMAPFGIGAVGTTELEHAGEAGDAGAPAPDGGGAEGVGGVSSRAFLNAPAAGPSPLAIMILDGGGGVVVQAQ